MDGTVQQRQGYSRAPISALPIKKGNSIQRFFHELARTAPMKCYKNGHHSDGLSPCAIPLDRFFSHSVHTYRTDECEHMTAGIARRHPSSRICKEEAPLPAEHFERCGVAFQIRKVLGEDLGGDVRYEALVPLSEGPRVVYNKNLPRT
jgi:hypothetical protein